MNYKKIILLLSLFALVFTTACDDDDDETIYGNWIEKPLFSGNGRSEAVSFTIGETFYYGLGYNGNNSRDEKYLTDFFSFSGGKAWTPLADFPGNTRIGAASFAVGTNGYLVGGYNADVDSFYNDVWEYNSTNDTWTQIADFEGGNRTDATAFVIDGVAYIVAGHSEKDGDKKDCWVFDANAKTFSKLADELVAKRYGATSFVIGNKAYVLGGYHNGYVSEVEVFDAATKTWLEDGARDLYLVKSLTDDIDHYDDPLDLRRAYASAFVIDGKAYFFGGNNGSVSNACWEYDPATDLWTEMNTFPGTMLARYKATAFSIADVPYVTGGTNGTSYFDDVWTFDPIAEEDDTDD